jgi:dUTP pyrophosphatase
MTLKLKIKRLSGEAKLPNYHYEGDAALNLYSVEDVLLKPNEQVSVKTGIAMIIPEGHTGLIWDRSGLSIKHGIKTLGGVIDAGYRGEVAVGFMNISKNDYQIEKGDKIAQIIIQRFENVYVEEIDEIEDRDTHRGEKGFGSSGK